MATLSRSPDRVAMMTVMDTSGLCTTMDELAGQTWTDVTQAREWGLHRGEVTITETLLLALKVYERQAGLGFVLSIVPTSQATERRSGADFEIWLQVGPNSYFAYSIQAKKASVSSTKRSGSYGTLNHEGDPSTPTGPNARKGAPFQYDTLIAHAARNQTIPVHLFYNGWRTAPSGVVLGNLPGDELYGCAVIPTPRVKAIREAKPRNNNQISAYAPELRPWSTLFRQPPPGGGPGNGPTGNGPSEGGPFGGSSGTGPSGGGLGSQPAGGSASREPGAPINTRNRGDLIDLGVSLGYDGSYPERLPPYISNAIEVSEAGRGELPDEPALPRFAVLIRDPQ